MDTLWFKDKLKDKQISQRTVAKHLELDPASVSLLLHGRRRMTPHEAHQISVILGVPILEVMRRAGIDVTEDVRKAPIAAHMDSQGEITAMPPGTHDIVISPGDCPVGTYAVQVRAANSGRDGWLLFVTPTQSAPGEHIDQLCVCATRAGQHLMGVVRKGYRRDTHNQILWPNDQTLTDADLVWVSPILWIRPA